MQHLRLIAQASLLALSMATASGASEPHATARVANPGASVPNGVYGRFLGGQFAMSQAEPNIAAEEFLKALALDPGSQALKQQAFLSAALSGRPEAVALARQLPDNQAAQLLLGNAAAKSGDWQAAEQRFKSLPREGLTLLLQPLLVAWAQQGDGQTDAALATLRPLVEGQRFRGIFALHAAMIADLGGQVADAARFYHIAEVESPVINLRLAQILASWQARSGHPEQARRILVALGHASPDMSLAVPTMIASAAQRPVENATEGMAEAYLALAGALRAQDSDTFATLMLRLGTDLRPDFTPARLVASELLGAEQHDTAALQALASVPQDDPLAPLVQLRRATLEDHMGQTQHAIGTLESLAARYENPVPLIVEGDILRSEQRFADAVPVYSRAIALLGRPKQSDWAVYYSRGIAYERSHDWPKAEADFRHALQLSPNQPAVLNYLGYSLADKDQDLGEARSMIEAAIRRRPNDGAITDSLGWVMLRQGQVGDAVVMLERAVELDPEDATINAHLGDAYWAAGRKLEAQYQWRRALTLNPAPDDMAKLEAKLQLPPKAAVISGQ